MRGAHRPKRQGQRNVLLCAVVVTVVALAATQLPTPPASAAAGEITTVAGSVVPAGDAAATGLVPVSVASDGATLLVVDSLYRVVRRVDPGAGTQVVVAGSGESGDDGDGGAATAARFSSPAAAAPDGSGGFYVVDSGAHKIRRVSSGGTITTVAGTGTAGYSGDGSTATAAQLSAPKGVVADGSGGFYVADSMNHRVRHVSAGGTITTFAGTGTAGYSGDGAAANLAQLNTPVAVAVSEGSVYIADQSNAAVRKVDAGGMITTVAAAPDLEAPAGLAAAAGGVYVSDRDNSRVLSVTDTAVTVVAGTGVSGYSGDGGPPAAATFSGLGGIAELNGSVYVADTGNSRVREIAATVSTVAGNGAGASGNGGLARNAQFASPRSVAVDAAGSVYVADFTASQLRRISPAGVVSAFAGTGEAGDDGDGGPASAAHLQRPAAVAVDAAGNVFVADSTANRVRKVSTTGTISTVAGTGTSGSSGDGGPATSATLNRPNGLAFDATGRLYIADSANNRVRRVASDGTITTVAGSGTSGFSGDGGAATAAKLTSPVAVAVAADGSFYIADSANDRVRRVDAGGTITTFAGNAVPPGDPADVGDGGPATSAYLYSPRGLRVDADGSVLIADAGNSRVRRVDTGGTITTVVGSSATGFAGDGGAATAAALTFPTAIARKANGDLLVADTSTRRVRSVAAGGAASGTPTAAFSYTTSGTLPLTVDLDASASSDPESAPLTYDWDFGDGGIGVGATPTHVYTDPGAYTITLTVTDPGGVSDTTTQGVVVTAPNEAPTAALVATPAAGTAPLAVLLDGSASSDPENGALTYTFDPGDGSTPASGPSATLAHTYTAPGSYTASLTVQDPLGASATDTAVVEVAGPQAPVATATVAPVSGQVPLTVDVDASASTDADGTIVSYDWDFGDGATATGSTGSHIYTTAGTYTVTLTVTDDDGLDDTASFTVDVSPQPPENLAPVASFMASPVSGDAPLDVTFDASASFDPDGTIATWYWDFGDGTTSNVGPVVTHRYENAGGFRATLGVTDDDGAVAATDREIGVNTPSGPAEDGVLVEITGAGMAPLAASGPGDFTITTTPGGVAAITGNATLSGGVTVTANVSSWRFFGQVLLNIGNVTVTDPGTGRVYPTLVLAKLTSPEPGLVEATSSWFSTNKTPWITYRMHWIIVDAG